MSILIPGVSMPKNEKAIHLELHSDGIVLMWQMGDDDKVVGTAIELPPHGRLIDVSKLPFDDVRLDEFGDWWMAVEDIEAAPTIIPASGGNENE